MKARFSGLILGVSHWRCTKSVHRHLEWTGWCLNQHNLPPAMSIHAIQACQHWHPIQGCISKHGGRMYNNLVLPVDTFIYHCCSLLLTQSRGSHGHHIYMNPPPSSTLLIDHSTEHTQLTWIGVKLFQTCINQRTVNQFRWSTCDNPLSKTDSVSYH